MAIVILQLSIYSPPYEWGVRLGGRYCCEDWNFALIWTNIDYSANTRIDTSSSVPTIFTHKAEFEIVDFEAGYCLPCFCNEVLVRPFWGVKRAWIKIKETRGEVNNLGTDDVAHYRGMGPTLGTYLQFPFICNTDLVLKGSSSVMEGGLKYHNAGEVPIFFNRCKECFYHMVAEIFVGVKYDCEVACNPIDLLVGYETQWWAFREVDSSQDSAHLGFGGLTARLNYYY